MGIGTGLAFIAIGAILAFAFHFHVSGIDVHTIGWILILVGAAMSTMTFAYTRPRRRRQVAQIVAEDSLYVGQDDDPRLVVRPAEVSAPTAHGRPLPRGRRDVTGYEPE